MVRTPLLVLIVAAALLAGCGDDGSNSAAMRNDAATRPDKAINYGAAMTLTSSAAYG